VQYRTKEFPFRYLNVSISAPAAARTSYSPERGWIVGSGTQLSCQARGRGKQGQQPTTATAIEWGRVGQNQELPVHWRRCWSGRQTSFDRGSRSVHNLIHVVHIGYSGLSSSMNLGPPSLHQALFLCNLLFSEMPENGEFSLSFEFFP